MLLDLVCNLAHAFDGRMTLLFVNSFQNNHIHSVMLTDDAAGFVDFGFQAVVKDEVELHIGMAFQHVV